MCLACSVSLGSRSPRPRPPAACKPRDKLTLGTRAATYGFAKQYSGVNLGSFMKHITCSELTAGGLRNIGAAVMQLAKVEQLEAHRRAVEIRLAHMDGR